VDMIAPDGCLNKPISFSGLDNIATITQWNWSFGDGDTSHQQNPVHSYAQEGPMTVSLNATTNGCTSVDVVKTINVAFADVTAMNDTIALVNVPLKLGSSFSGNTLTSPSFSWSPPAGLDNPNAMAPTAILQDDITYVVTASIAEGCTDKDTVNIKVFKGSAIYVPTGFTPNGDGLNDKLKPLYVAIKRLDYFRVYNRWGTMVYQTNVIGEGWDGTYKGSPQGADVFTWTVEASGNDGRNISRRGTSILIR